MVEARDALLRLRTDDLTWREVGDELLVLKISTATYLTLNNVGRELWGRLEAGATVADLIEGLVDKYRITTEQATDDVTSFVQELRERELVTDDETTAGEV